MIWENLVPLDKLTCRKEFLTVLQTHKNLGLARDQDQNEWLSKHVYSFPLRLDPGPIFLFNAELTNPSEFAHKLNRVCLPS